MTGNRVVCSLLLALSMGIAGTLIVGAAGAEDSAKSMCQKFTLSAEYLAEINALNDATQKERSIAAETKQRLANQYAVIKERNDSMSNLSHPVCAGWNDYFAGREKLKAAIARKNEVCNASANSKESIVSSGCPWGGGTLPKEQAARCNALIRAHNANHAIPCGQHVDSVKSQTQAQKVLYDSLTKRGGAYIDELKPRVIGFMTDAKGALTQEKVKATLAELDKLVGQLSPLK